MHLNEECPERVVACPLECNAQLKFSSLQSHTENEVTDLHCTRFTRTLLVYYMYSHSLNIDHGINQFLRVSNLQCPHRIVTCLACAPNGVAEADYTMTKKALDEHVATCPYTCVDCPKGCGQSVQRRLLLSEHEPNCPCRLVACPFAPECQVRQP